MPIPVDTRRWLARTLWGFAEVAVTLGLVVLLFVTHQLWWTNLRARDGAERQVEALRQEWGRLPAPVLPAETQPEPESAPEPGTGTGTGGGGGSAAPAPRHDRAYAVLSIPAIGVTVPVAEGTGKADVLNRGYAGHYPGTAQPGRTGNFAVAGHRNTHGEPFRQLDEVAPGDRIVVETRRTRFTYTVDRVLPRTTAADGATIAPVPSSSVHPAPENGYAGPGRYITLTTCTPEFTSRYRLVVWGHLTTARPR